MAMSVERTLQLLDDRLALRLRCIDLRSLLDTLQLEVEDLSTRNLRALYDRELAMAERQLRSIAKELQLLGVAFDDPDTTLH
jgi:hypothetical protein